MTIQNVVFVHGLWMNGVDMGLLRHRLANRNFTVYQFSYHSLRSSPIENAVLLQKYLRDVRGKTVHFVAHSLGGLLLRHLFHLYPDQRPGHVVMLGTPHTGSAVAGVLVRSAWGRFILGKSTDQGLLGDAPDWRSKNPLGVIAGDRPFGAGRLIHRFEGPNDGTVAVDETRLNHMTDHLVLPTTHMGLIFNKNVMHQARLFIDQGCFEHP